MRIALLAPFGLQPKGTVSARMVPLAQALAHRGHMVRLIIPPWDDPSAQPGSVAAVVSMGADGSGKTAGVHTVALALPRHLPKSVALTHGLVKEALAPTALPDAPFETEEERAALRALTSFRAEVVHVFKPVGYSGLAGFVLSAMRVPWVLDLDDWEGAGGFSSRDKYSTLERASIFLMEALLPRMAGAVTVASRTLEARAWNMGIPRRRVGYMPNGVWRDRYSTWSEYSQNGITTSQERSSQSAAIRNQYGLEGGPVVLLYTRFAEFPYRWPLRIFKRVLADHPDARLLVVGNGFHNEEGRLRVAAQQMGLADRVAVTGRVPEASLPAYLSLGDVAVYPMADNLLNRAKSPVKVIEPMLLGIPVVAHRVGQAAEFVGDTGVLVEPGNLEEMARAVSSLLSDRKRRKLLGVMAQERVWSHFNWETLSGVAEKMYNIALGRES